MTTTDVLPRALEIVPDPTCFGRCSSCGQRGQPYEYRGLLFGGLCARQGERLCPPCRDERLAADGVSILVVSYEPQIPPRVVNSVEDRDTAFIGLVFPDRRGGYGHTAAHEHRADRSPCCCPCTSCALATGRVKLDVEAAMEAEERDGDDA